MKKQEWKTITYSKNANIKVWKKQQKEWKKQEEQERKQELKDQREYEEEQREQEELEKELELKKQEELEKYKDFAFIWKNYDYYDYIYGEFINGIPLHPLIQCIKSYKDCKLRIIMYNYEINNPNVRYDRRKNKKNRILPNNKVNDIEELTKYIIELKEEISKITKIFEELIKFGIDIPSDTITYATLVNWKFAIRLLKNKGYKMKNKIYNTTIFNKQISLCTSVDQAIEIISDYQPIYKIWVYNNISNGKINHKWPNTDIDPFYQLTKIKNTPDYILEAFISCWDINETYFGDDWACSVIECALSNNRYNIVKKLLLAGAKTEKLYHVECHYEGWDYNDFNFIPIFKFKISSLTYEKKIEFYHYCKWLVLDYKKFKPSKKQFKIMEEIKAWYLSLFTFHLVINRLANQDNITTVNVKNVFSKDVINLIKNYL